MKMLERCHWRLYSVFIVHCKHISNFVLIIDFEHPNIYWVHIDKKNTFQDKNEYIMRYVVVF